MHRQNWLVAAIAVLALAGGFGVASWLKQPGTAQLSPGNLGAAGALLSAPLQDLHNQTQTLAQYRGKVLIVNFWAAWCPPCRAEIPAFIKMQAKFGANGLQFVGIALDTPDQVSAFAREFGINYPILIGGINESEALRQLGNPGGGLPYTLIYDRSGNLRERLIGGLDEARLEHLLAPYLH